MKVRALTTLFWGGALRYPGAVFDVPDDYPLKGVMEPASVAPKPADPEPESHEPATLSEMARGIPQRSSLAPRKPRRDSAPPQ